MNYYYTDESGSVAGPVKHETLQKLVDCGLAPRDSQVCSEGSEEWKPISTILRATDESKVAPTASPQPASHALSNARAVSLICTSCGASLDITPDLDIFSCGYCGHRLLVRRSGGTVSLKSLEEAVSRVQHGTDRTAAELALRRLREDLAAKDEEIAKLRAQFLVQNNSSAGCLMILIIGSVISVLIMDTASKDGAVPFLTAFIGTVVCAWVYVYVEHSRTQKRLKEAEKPLLIERRRIEMAIEEQLRFLESPR